MIGNLPEEDESLLARVREATLESELDNILEYLQSRQVLAGVDSAQEDLAPGRRHAFGMQKMAKLAVSVLSSVIKFSLF